MSDGSAERTQAGQGGDPPQPAVAGISIAAVAEVARALAAAGDQGAVMQRAAEGARRLTGAVGSYVERIIAGAGEVEVEVAAGSGRGTPSRGSRFAYPGSLSHAAGGADPRELRGVGVEAAPYLAESCRGCTALLVPLTASGEALGTLVVLRDPDAGPFRPEEAAGARTVGELASLSLGRVLVVERAQRERGHMAALLESTGEGIFGIDLAGRCTFINPAAVRMLGYRPEECLGREMHALVHHHRPDGTPYPYEECPIREAFRSGAGIRADDEVLWRRDGTHFPAEYAAFPILQDGQVTGVVVTFVDVTEWKRVEAIEQRHSRQLRSLADAALAISSASPVEDLLQVITEQARLVIGAHQAVSSVTQTDTGTQAIRAVSLSDDHAARKGYSEPTDGSGIYRLVADGNRPLRMTREELESHPGWSRAGDHAASDPPERGWLAVPLIARDGSNIGLIQLSERYEGEFTEQDEAVLVQFAQMAAVAIENAHLFTEAQAARRAAERARAAAETAQAEAEAADRAKSEFLSTVSHEIRTPINAIIGYVDLLDLEIAGPVTDRQRAYLERVRISGQHLIGLINDVLDLAKVEAGRMAVEHERSPAVSAIAAAIALVGPQASQKRIDIRDPCSDETGTDYVGDQDRVRQILVNLLSNAVKFTDEGGELRITCGVTRDVDPGVQAAEEGPMTFIRVQDTGIGITPEQVERIFQPFTQVEQGHTRAQGGTGLGLTISRRLARLMGGDLTVESEPGAGSTFTLWLPHESPAEAPLEAAVREAAGEVLPAQLAAVGRGLQEEIDLVLERYAARMWTDPLIPMTAGLGEADLADHGSAFLADLSQSLVVLEESRTVPERLLRDGSEIQRVIAELHGEQRAQLGWTMEALGREYQILREEVLSALWRIAPRSADIPGAVRLLTRFMDRAERISVRALRRASLK